MPITWHNINAPSMAGVSRGFAAAGDGITAGFDRLASTLSTYEAGAQALKERTDQGLVLDLKTALSNAKTPEQVQALQGQLQDITSRLTTNKGREGVLGAEDARMSAVQNQMTAANAFKAGLRNDAQATALAEFTNPTALAEARAKAERSPIQIALDDAALRSKATLQPTQLATDALATTAKNRAALFDASQAPTLETQAIQASRIKGLNQTTELGDAQNKVEDQNLQAIISKEGAATQAQLLGHKTAYGQLGLKLGIPLDPSGGPDLAAASPEQRLRLTSAGIMQNLPDIGSLYGGDTKRTNDFVQSLRARGVSADAIDRNTGAINNRFSTINASAPKGNDALAAGAAQVRQDFQQEQRDKMNWYTPGKANVKNSYEALAKQIEPMFAKDSNMAEDLPDINALLSRAATTGIEVRKGVFLTPSTEDMMSAVRAHMGDNNLWNDSRAKAIEKTLKNSLSTERVTLLQKQALESEKASEDRAVRQYLNQSFGYGLPSTPAAGAPIPKK